jgi:hypothetical protein
MAQAIEQYRLAATRERRDGTEVGHVTGGEEKCALPSGEGGQLLLERSVLAPMSAHEMRGAAARAAACRGVRHGGGQSRVGGEPEIVVAAEVDEPVPVDHYLRAAALLGARLYRGTATPQLPPLDLLEHRLKRLSLHARGAWMRWTQALPA